MRQAPCDGSSPEARMLFRITAATILLALSYGCGSSSTTPTPTTPNPATVSASIVSGSSALSTTAYSPNPINVAVGGTVTWTNADSIAHTSTGNGGTWDSGVIAPGGRFSRAFPTTGTFG